MLYEKVKKTIQDHSLLKRGDTVICAVSGGADSMCLLTLMLKLSKEMDLTVAAANLNHCLRGPESDGDSQFVETVCEIKGVPFYGKRVDVALTARARGLSLEEAGREERYKFFDELSAQLGGAKIATGHNLSDNAETIIFRLARGSGAKGLCGIRYSRDNIIRPLLDATRKEIEAYLVDNAVMWREDSSNSQLCYSRNKIRHAVIPRLEEIQPAAVEKIVSCGHSIAEDEEYLSSLAEKLLSSAFVDEDEYSTSAILGAPPPIARRAAAKLLENWGAKDITQEKIMSFLDLCSKPSGKRMDLSGGAYVLRSFYTVLRQTRQTERGFSYTLKPGQTLRHEDWELSIRLSDQRPPRGANCVAVFDPNQLFGSFTVRSRQDGDRIKLRGGGSKKLQDLFVDQKIPLSMRSRVPVILKGEEVIFVPPYRRTPRYQPDPEAKSFLIIEYKEIKEDEK